ASIRGATAAETPVYLAGVRLNDDVGGWADLSLVPLWMLHSVEIYRSNAPIEGDQLGIGGAIFFEPKRPRKLEGSVGEMLGSFGARSVWAHVGAGNARAAAIVGARLEEATNDYTYTSDQGTVFNPSNSRVLPMTNADAHTLDVWGLGSVALGDNGRADLVVNEVERRQGLPRALYPTTQARVSVSRQLAAVSTRTPCGKPGCELTTTTSALTSASAYDDPLHEAALYTTHLDLVASRVEESALARWPVVEGLTLIPSARVAVEKLALLPTGSAPLHAERVSGRAAIGGEWQAHRLVRIHAMGSVECDGTSVAGNSPWALPGDGPGAGATLSPCSDAEPAARLGVQIGQRPFALLVNAGRFARVPTLAEKYGLSGAVRGNAALAPEHGLSADVGVRAAAQASSGYPEVAVDLFGFVRYANDLVAYERTSLGYVQPFNVGAARVLGAELAADFSPVRYVRLDLATTVLDPRDVSPGRTTVNDLLPYQARLVIVPRVEARLPVDAIQKAPTTGARVVRSVKVAASYFYEAARYADPAGLVVIPAQGSLDLEAEVAMLDDHLSLRGRLSNLLDQPRVDFIGYPL